MVASVGGFGDVGVRKTALARPVFFVSVSSLLFFLGKKKKKKKKKAHTIPPHQREVFHRPLVTFRVKKRANDGPVGIRLGPANEEILSDFLISNNQKLSSQHFRPVESRDGPVFVRPLLKLEPHVVDGKVVDAADIGIEGWAWWAVGIVELSVYLDEVNDGDSDDGGA